MNSRHMYFVSVIIKASKTIGCVASVLHYGEQLLHHVVNVYQVCTAWPLAGYISI